MPTFSKFKLNKLASNANDLWNLKFTWECKQCRGQTLSKIQIGFSCLIQLVSVSEHAFAWMEKMFLAKRFLLEIHKLQEAPAQGLRTNKVKQLHFWLLFSKAHLSIFLRPRGRDLSQGAFAEFSTRLLTSRSSTQPNSVQTCSHIEFHASECSTR